MDKSLSDAPKMVYEFAPTAIITKLTRYDSVVALFWGGTEERPQFAVYPKIFTPDSMKANTLERPAGALVKSKVYLLILSAMAHT